MTRILQILDNLANRANVILIVEINPFNIVFNLCINACIVLLGTANSSRCDAAQDWSAVFGTY